MGEVIEFRKKEEFENNYINEIHNYYLNSANVYVYGYDLLDEDIFNNIDNIMLIKL